MRHLTTPSAPDHVLILTGLGTAGRSDIDAPRLLTNAEAFFTKGFLSNRQQAAPQPALLEMLDSEAKLERAFL